MKRIKWLLTIPAASMVVIPTVAGCSCNKEKEISVTFSGDSTVFTAKTSIYGTFTFTLSDSVNKNNITAVATKIDGGTFDGDIKVKDIDVVDNTLKIQVYFDTTTTGGSISGGDNIMFKLAITINGKTTSFSSLQLVYRAEVNPIPRRGLLISGEDKKVLNGINPEFDTAFYDSLYIPDDIVEISEEAFKNAFTSTLHPTIKTIKLNSALTTVGKNAFNGCAGIDTINVSELSKLATLKVTFGTDAFTNWQSSGTIVYDEDKTYNNPVDYKLYDAGLGKNWFASDVVRPVPTEDFEIASSTVLWGFKDNLPKHIDLCNQILVPANIKTVYEKAFCKDKETTTIPSNIVSLKFEDESVLTSIGAYAFKCAPFVGEVVLPSKITSIGDYAFAKAKKIEYVNMEETSIESIGKDAFESCIALTTVWFPRSLQTIGDEAYLNCSSLATIDVTAFMADDVPAGWKNQDVFKNVSETGAVWCPIIKAVSWGEYFETYGIDIESGKWFISEYADLSGTEDYEAYIAPLDPTTTTDIVTMYRQYMNYSTLYFVEDLYHSIYSWSRVPGQKVCELNQLMAKIHSVGVTGDGRLNFCIDFKFKLTAADEPIINTWTFTNIPIDPSIITATKNSDNWEFKYNNLLDDEFWTLQIIEGDTTTRISHQNIKQCLQDPVTTQCGSLFPKFHAFAIDGEAVTWYFKTFYLGNVTKE